MEKRKIFKFIKSPCGQSKYEELILNKTLMGRARLYWFIFFASIRDIRY